MSEQCVLEGMAQSFVDMKGCSEYLETCNCCDKIVCDEHGRYILYYLYFICNQCIALDAKLSLIIDNPIIVSSQVKPKYVKFCKKYYITTTKAARK